MNIMILKALTTSNIYLKTYTIYIIHFVINL